MYVIMYYLLIPTVGRSAKNEYFLTNNEGCSGAITQNRNLTVCNQYIHS